MNTTSVTESNLISLSADYSYKTGVGFIPVRDYYNDGYTFVNNPIFNYAKDVRFANDTLFFVTSAGTFGNFIESDQGDAVFSTLVSYISLSANGKFITNVSNALYLSGDGVTPTDEQLFRLTISDGSAAISYGKKYFTVNRTAPWNITLADAIQGDPYHQQVFDYCVVDDTIALSTKFTTNESYGPSVVKKYISYSSVTDTIRAIGIISDDDYDPSNPYIFTMGLYEDNLQIGFYDNVGWVKYYNEYYNKQNNTNAEKEETVFNIKQNYLVDCPYKTKVNNTHGAMNINIANLKNIQTPEYETTQTPYICGNTLVPVTSANKNDALKRREYEKIFTGTNQDYGFENPYLGFTASTKEVVFKKDNVTYFHYPKTALAGIALSSMGIEDSGSTAGTTPFRADKIWKKNANYSKNIWWGDSIPWQHGTWLCSWLSGNEVNKAWMDRWFYPGYVTLIHAISSNTDTYTVVPNSGDLVWDEPSRMTFDGGVWYKYYHFGELGNNSVVSTLTGDGTELKLNLKNWAPTTEDSSPYNNDGTIENYKAGVINGNAIVLNGVDQDCMVPYNSSYFLTGDMSYSVWIKTNNWGNCKAKNLVGTEFRGGWGLGYTNGFSSSIYPVYDTTYGHVVFTNINDKMYFDRLLPTSGSELTEAGNPTVICLDNNLYTWILDDKYKKVHIIDYNGDIVKQITFDSSVTLSDMAINSAGNVGILDTVSNNISSFTFNGTFDSVSAVSSSYICFDYDLSNNIVGTSGNDICVDNDGVTWVANDDGILKAGTLIYAYSDAVRIVCDADNSIWGTSSNTYIKLNSAGSVLLSGSIGNTTTNMDLGFINEYDDGLYYDRVLFVNSTDNKIFKYTISGVYISDNNLLDGINTILYSDEVQSSISFQAKGDFTGYDWQRKYNYVLNGETTYIRANTNFGNLLLSATSTLKYPTSGLVNNKWHHFMVQYNSVSGECNLYVDTALEDTVYVNAGSNIFYYYKNPLLIGANVGKRLPLDTELSIDTFHAKADFKDLRIYNTVLDRSDVMHIYKLELNFYDMTWNMPIGSQEFMEEIERFFKHKVPGIKSQYFNIILKGLNITNEETRSLIEDIIKDTVKKISPAYTELYSIIWK